MHKVYYQKDFFNLQELEQYSGLSIRFLRKALKDHENPLPCFRINKKTILVSKIDFIDWLEKYRASNNDDINIIVSQVMNETVRRPLMCKKKL